MKKGSLETRIASLYDATDANDIKVSQKLVKALRSKTAVIVSHGAQIAIKRRLINLLPNLEETFEHFLNQPTSKDPGCLAKNRLVEACEAFGSRKNDLFLRGVRYVQFEPVWGGKEDSAVGIRVQSLGALFRLQHPQAILEAARLLADSEPLARAGAARMIANGIPMEGIPLLRYKAIIGDESERVTEETLGALLALDPEGSIDFVAEFLQSSNEIIGDMTALLLGESKLENACVPLIQWTNIVSNHRLKTAYTALAILRSRGSIEYLLDEIQNASLERAVLVLETLEPFTGDTTLVSRIRDAASRRAPVMDVFCTLFEKQN